MKTTISRVIKLSFSESEEEILKELGINRQIPRILFNEFEVMKIINLLIDINPTKQEHKDFIMEFIKELKRWKIE